MKRLPVLLPFSILLLFIISCHKNDAVNCPFRQTDFYQNDSFKVSNKYEFDDLGRITKMIYNYGPDISTYRYYPDSVVASHPTYSVVYFLTNGLATRSVTRYPVNPNNLGLEEKFTYDADGYMVQRLMIFTQTYLGTVLKDTSIENYTISGGNVVKLSGTNTTDAYFEYSSLAMNSKIPELSFFPSRMGAYLGKSPRNTVARIKDAAGNPAADLTYITDKEGRITGKQVKSYYSPNKQREVYVYKCN